MTLFEKIKLLDSGSGSTLEDYKFLYGFISLIQPDRILDIGTNHGLSAIVMAAALRDCGLKGSRVLTIDKERTLQEKAAEQIKMMGLSRYIKIKHGTSSILTGSTHFDVVFVDGDHSLQGCLTDFENVKDRATYILFHDTIDSKFIKVFKTKNKDYDVLTMEPKRWGTQWSLGKPVYRSMPGITVVRKNDF